MEKKYTKKQLVIGISTSIIITISVIVGGAFALLQVNPFGNSLNSLELQQAQQIIAEQYYGEVDEAQLQAGAIAGAVAALGDPHSAYLTPEETKAFLERLESSFEGIGAVIQKLNGKVIISDVLENSPAQQAGLQQNDQIQAVDGNDVAGQSLDEVISQVKGPSGTTVELTLARQGKTEVVPITRASIAQESAKSQLPMSSDQTYGYIDMRESFGVDTAAEFATAIADLAEMETLIIDLRDNPGGYLQAVSDILSTLVSKEQPYVIVEQKDGTQKPYTSDLATNAPFEYVILVNENTASAAEIMTAALQQLAGATVIGQTTYGKGTVQQQFDLMNGGVLKLTIEQWLTPDGTSINETGIVPDVEVSPSVYYQLPMVILSEPLTVEQANMKVLTVQYMLQQAGYPVTVVDGVFHEELVPILQAYQKDQQIPVTGIIDVPTANKINAQLKAYQADSAHDVQLQSAIEQAIK